LPIIVQKYGGSSVADAEKIKNVALRIAEAHGQGNQVVAVVSAMGDTTDTLIELASEVSERPDPREMDVLLSTGELMSCTLVAMAVRSLGLDAISLSGAQAGIRTDSRHGKARIAAVDTARISSELSAGRVVIVAGFQGITEDMNVTTLGRGASDLSAVAIAAALRADRCEVYTDVEGIYTADPRHVPQARKLDEVGYEEMLEMASLGAKMQPRSIELAMEYDVPILVASSFVDAPGTLIHQGADMQQTVGEIRNRARAVTTDRNVAKITVTGIVDRPGISASLLEPLADADISVDIIVQTATAGSDTDLAFTVSRDDLPRALDIVRAVAVELGGGEVISADHLAKVSVVGTAMQNAPGYASRMFRVLANENINIDMISTSEIRITCVIDEDRLADAARALHTAFELDEPE
jgi:aspartate kinase